MAATEAMQLISYETWCQCARVLLGWGNEAGEVRPDLYASGLTPLAAVRAMLLGKTPETTLH